jgi:ATP-dependent Lon protease
MKNPCLHSIKGGAAWNRKDMEDIPANVQKSIKFRFLEDMLEVLKLALETKGKKKG